MTKRQSAARRGGHGGGGRKSPAARERAVLALLSERTTELAAAKAGVGVRTLMRWMAEDEPFRAQLASARQSAFDAGMARVTALAGKAIETLDALLSTENTSVRLGAARTVAELAIHEDDKRTILRKLDDIEALQQRQGKR